MFICVLTSYSAELLSRNPDLSSSILHLKYHTCNVINMFAYKTKEAIHVYNYKLFPFIASLVIYMYYWFVYTEYGSKSFTSSERISFWWRAIAQLFWHYCITFTLICFWWKFHFVKQHLFVNLPTLNVCQINLPHISKFTLWRCFQTRLICIDQPIVVG